MPSEFKGRHENGYFVVDDVPVNLIYGFCIRSSSAILTEMQNYQNRVIFSKDGERTSGKLSIMEILLLGVGPGSVIGIEVEELPGTDAEKIAKKFYVGVRTNDVSPDFNRLEDIE